MMGPSQYDLTTTPQPTEPAATVRGAAVSPTPAHREAWRSEELLGERTEVLIVHGHEVYRLRRTRQDKLILCK
jgi:hemin uptake protein HemP